MCGSWESGPDRAEVEALQGFASRLHVGKAAHPDELVRIVAIAELANNPHSLCFLPLDEMLLEQGDEIIAATGFHRILA